MPNLIGMTEDAGPRRDRRRRARASAQPEYVADADVARGKVIEQDPNRGPVRRPGHLRRPHDLAPASRWSTVPFVVGQDQDDARDRRSRPPTWCRRSTEKESDEPKGQVIETDPASGEHGRRRAPRSPSTISDGPREGARTWSGSGPRRREKAIARRRASSRVRPWRRQHRAEPKGTVIDQSPRRRPAAAAGHDGRRSSSRRFEPPTETPPTDRRRRTPRPAPPTDDPDASARRRRARDAAESAGRGQPAVGSGVA